MLPRPKLGTSQTQEREGGGKIPLQKGCGSPKFDSVLHKMLLENNKENKRAHFRLEFFFAPSPLSEQPPRETIGRRKKSTQGQEK